jgi:carbonic anhydrase
MTLLNEYLARNKEWSAQKKDEDPEFFARLARQQAPDFLWIGCSDARVSANQILGMDPGEIFVHRNIANLVHPIDFNLLAVLQYAVDALGVQNIIVCGHYGCGGVRAALDRKAFDMVDNWLQPIRDIQRLHQRELRDLPSDAARMDRLTELNVRHQVINVCRTRVVQEAWSRGHELTVHGMIYAISDGLIHDIDCTIDGTDSLEPLFHFDQGDSPPPF